MTAAAMNATAETIAHRYQNLSIDVVLSAAKVLAKADPDSPEHLEAEAFLLDDHSPYHRCLNLDWEGVRERIVDPILGGTEIVKVGHGCGNPKHVTRTALVRVCRLASTRSQAAKMLGVQPYTVKRACIREGLDLNAMLGREQ